MAGFFNKNYKKLIIIPSILMIVFIYLAFFNPSIEKGIDLKGGNQIILHYPGQKDYSTIEPILKEKYNISEFQINETRNLNEYGLIIQFSSQKDIELVKDNKSKIDFENTNLQDLKTDIKELLDPLVNIDLLDISDINEIDSIDYLEDLKEYTNQTINLAKNNFNNNVISIIKEELNLEDDVKLQSREVVATLGSDFVSSSIKVGAVAFILLIIVILLFFKEIIPSGLIIFSAIFDILAALAGMALFNLSLSLTTIPALLMLIGYSVDTDILLSTRLLKSKNADLISVANNTMKTGITMTLTTLLTVVVMLIVSYSTQMLVVYEIATVLIFGLLGDLISTWFFNAPALMNYSINKRINKNK
jgi:preprotein translocase subunit SecF